MAGYLKTCHLLCERHTLDRMDIPAHEIRKRRVRQWIDEHFEGNVAAFCRYYQMPKTTAAYLSQLFNGLRQFGEKAARKMEQQAGKPHGWLDWPDGVAVKAVAKSEPPLFRYDRERVAALPERERQKIEDFITFVCEQHDARTAPVKGAFRHDSVESPSPATKQAIIRSSKRPLNNALTTRERSTQTTRTRKQAGKP